MSANGFYLDETGELRLWDTRLPLVHKVQDTVHLPAPNILKYFLINKVWDTV